MEAAVGECHHPVSNEGGKKKKKRKVEKKAKNSQCISRD